MSGLLVETKRKPAEISEIQISPDTRVSVQLKLAGESGPTFASYLGRSFPTVEMSPVCSFSSAIGWTRAGEGLSSSVLSLVLSTIQSDPSPQTP